MARKKLILHIGTHKTGTSTIQSTLEAAREQLAAAGVCYPRTDREPFSHLAKHSSAYRAITETDAAFDDEFAILEKELADTGGDTLLLSEEGFSEAQFDAFSRFSRLTDRYDLTVVCFLRRQDQFLESLWAQYCREGHERQVIADFVQRDGIRRRAEYATLLDFWSNFGTVVPLLFDKTQSKDIVSTFGERLGLALNTPERRQNVSPGMNAAAALALLNRFDLAYDRPRLVNAFRENDVKHALGSKLRAELMDQFADQNAQLRERYGIVFDETMPEEPVQPLRLPRPAALANALSKLSQSTGT